MERMSGILRQIMLSILIGILALALALACLRGLKSPSYLAALALGVPAGLAIHAVERAYLAVVGHEVDAQ